MIDKQKDLINYYLKNTSVPSFNHFVRTERSLIEKISVVIETKTALRLQKVWVKTYNNCIQVERPEQKQQKKPTSVSKQFKKIFEIAKEVRDASHEFRISTLQLSRMVYSASRSDYLHNIITQEEEEVDVITKKHDDLIKETST